MLKDRLVKHTCQINASLDVCKMKVYCSWKNRCQCRSIS